MTKRDFARHLAADALQHGKPLEWFETLYAQANGDHTVVPWADMTVNPNLAAWLKRKAVAGAGRKALVVGCGLGDDAEALSSLGFLVKAIDISTTCIEWCRARFSESKVEYSVADLFAPASSFHRGFDFVCEAYTLQVLPPDLRRQAMEQIADCVAPNGTLLVITRGREDSGDAGKMPWPLLRQELAVFVQSGLSEIDFEDYVEAEQSPVRRFRVEYRRGACGTEQPQG